MSTSGNGSKKKGSRVSGVPLPPNRFAQAIDMLKRADVLSRIGMCALTGLIVWIATAGWQPPFAYRENDVPARAISARVDFRVLNEEETNNAREAARKEVVTIYTHNRTVIEQLRLQLLEKVRQIVRAESLDALEQDPTTQGVWTAFMHGVPLSPDGDPNNAKTNAQFFQEFREEFLDDEDLRKYTNAITLAMARMERDGLLRNLQHDFDRDGGSQSLIRVDPGTGRPFVVSVEDVLIEHALAHLDSELKQHLREPLARHTYAWFSVKDRLQQTLLFDPEETLKVANAEAKLVSDVHTDYAKESILAHGGEPLSAEDIVLLRHEYEEACNQMSVTSRFIHSLANFGMYSAIFLLCGFYSVLRRRDALTDTRTLFRVLLLATITIVCCQFFSSDYPQTVIIPLLLFSMTVVIAYDQELALLLSTVMALVVVESLGFQLQEFTIYVAAMATAVLCLRHVRSRTKLIYVGLATAAATMATAIGSSTLGDALPGIHILIASVWYGFFAVVAGLLMTGLLPFIEKSFDVQTELSLLELADVSHPLLQELVRRAPGTYNHSINVASLAEAAADAIGCNGLLARVGAYFHDIGKMLKPGYFIENQGDGTNRHESLLPAMSTLVIIAHVKDGADLARQHNLPKSLIDFIMQHHGTTLVEYFYNRANEQSESDPDGGEVDEHSYRYPGPKPQTKEAAVLMLADTVESAGRTLIDPTPSRIESLVRELAMKKLLDGQFDECGLTLAELSKIEKSLIKTMAAVYHARIKYPDPQSA